MINSDSHQMPDSVKHTNTLTSTKRPEDGQKQTAENYKGNVSDSNRAEQKKQKEEVARRADGACV